MSLTITGKALALALGSLLLTIQTARAAEVHATVSGALTGAFRDLVPTYESQTGNKLVIAWGPSSGTSPDAIPVRVRAGGPLDVLIMVAPSMDKLVKEGLFKPAEREDVAESGIGVGVRTGAPRPDVSSAAALRDTLLKATSIGYSEGASGVYVATELLHRLGIADQVASKLKKVTGELVGDAIARGEVDVGIQQISELRAVKGVDYLGPLPPGLQNASVMVAAVSQNAPEPEAAKGFLTFLTSPIARAAFAKSGLDTPAPR